MSDTRFAPVVDTSQSPHATLRPLSVGSFHMHDSFWAPRVEINRTVTLPSQYEQLRVTNRLRNFERAAGRFDGPFDGIYFNDSDVYKWLEAASWALLDNPTAELISMVDKVVELIEGAQDKNGYLNTYFSVDRVHERWTKFQLHEMYCAGHFFQAAVAHFRATGSRRLLAVACRFADHICETFGPKETGRREEVCGHQEIKMALVELYRATGNGKYLEQAQFFFDYRGRSGSIKDAYNQAHLPFREINDVTGHAVRAMYYEAAGADLYAESGEALILAALGRHWVSTTQRRMYVTGGLGALWAGETFGKDYELPSDTAYAETCASIGALMWNWRMLLATGEARYADIVELMLYNGILSGLSLDGQQYFYQNPLADNGKHRRQAWFGCACCPPNVARLLASLSGYVACASNDAIYLNMWVAGKLTAALPDGQAISLEVATDYPWDGHVKIVVTEAPTRPISIKFRIPAWTADATITNPTGHSIVATPGEYAAISATWKSGDTVTLDLPMPVRPIEPNPAIEATAGRLALMRGPLVYAIEQADHTQDIRNLRISRDTAFKAAWRKDLLGGITTITGDATLADSPDWNDTLYREAVRSSVARATLTAIPYYAWANRDAGPMRVWIPAT